jgi:methionyl-tRNA formyltransferase
MKLTDIAMILIENNRSRAYIQRMAFHNLLPSFVVFLENPSGTITPGQRASDLNAQGKGQQLSSNAEFQLDEQKSVVETLQGLGVDYQILKTTDINSDLVVDAVEARKESVFIYSGPGGAIVKKALFATGKKLLHIHPGLVPEYRGSTTIYYSLLNENRSGASAIFLSEEIDEGPVLARKEFAPPRDRRQLDYLYDPLVRSELLVEVLLRYQERGSFEATPQQKGGEVYYIMHPVLRHICILSRRV